MEYQDLYSKYKTALKLRDLSENKDYQALKEAFLCKILDKISISTKAEIIPYLAGIKEVFCYVEEEAKLLSSYRDMLDEMLQGDNKSDY